MPLHPIQYAATYLFLGKPKRLDIGSENLGVLLLHVECFNN